MQVLEKIKNIFTLRKEFDLNEELETLRIEDLELPTRTVTALRKQGVYSFAQMFRHVLHRGGEIKFNGVGKLGREFIAMQINYYLQTGKPIRLAK